ncbi:Uncharacterised protein [Mycobacteroides abscessus subsp. abscessus]|nr:Uncharacterised protein [Mycobacteroides abscessus subsp. abscessus]
MRRGARLAVDEFLHLWVHVVADGLNPADHMSCRADRRDQVLAPVVQFTDDALALDDQLVEVVVLLGDIVQDGVEVVDQSTQRLIAPGKGFGDLGGLRDNVGQRTPVTGEGVDESVGQIVDLLRVQKGEQRFEAVEQRADVEGRFGSLHRDDAAFGQALRTAFDTAGQRDVALTDDVLVGHRDNRVAVKVLVALDPELQLGQ